MKHERARQTPRWRGLLPPRPFLAIFGFYIAAVLFFTVLRVLFMSSFSGLMENEPLAQIVRAYLIGFRFDQIIVLMSLIPASLLVFWIKTDSRIFRGILVTYLTLVFAFHFLLLLADIRFYSYFDSHLNFLAVEYLGEGALAGNLILSDPEFLPTILTWCGLSVLFFIAVLLVLKFVAVAPHRRSWSNHIVYFVILLALVALGVRGRISLAPMDWGIAYFSENRFLNQLALNGIYTLGRNLSENNRDPRLVYLPEQERFPFVPLPEALTTTREMLHTETDGWLEPSRSLLRATRQPEASFDFRPNIVIIVSESWSAKFTGSLGDVRNLTPNFDRLARRGVLFENFYASGTRTNYGISAVFCSFPALPGRAIMKRYNAHHPFVSLPELLDERGYHNAFAYGGDLAFDNMEGFLREKKFHAFFGDRELGRNLYFSKWGIPDHILFEKAAHLMDSVPRPFQLTVLTLSNHEPWDLPDSTVRRYFDDEDSSKVFNSQLYADYSLGRFFDIVENKPLFDSTIFVFLSDHGRYGRSQFALDLRFFHIPLLIYSPRLLGDTALTVSVFGDQTDILPTIMGLLGGDYIHASWGRDLLNLPEGDSGFAVMSMGERIAYIDNTYLYAEELGGLTAYGTTVAGEIEDSWFGVATLKRMDVLGRPYDDGRWMDAAVNCLDEPFRFAALHALNRVGDLGRGHIVIQALNPSDDNRTGGAEPAGLVKSRDRLHRYLQAADQLSTPE